MTFITIPIDERKKLLSIAESERESIKNCSHDLTDYWRAYRAGFIDCLKCRFPSETIGLLIMEYDQILDDDSDLITERLPKA